VKSEISNNYVIDIGPMGPIGEGAALILRVTRNCPWNKCLFCPTYKGNKFGHRDVEEIKRDIDAVKRIENLINATFEKIGWPGIIKPEIVNMIMIRSYPEIYSKDDHNLTPENYNAGLTLNNVVNWILYGKKRVFLQDANSLFMKPNKLIEVLGYLKATFPTIETVTSYARSKTCAQRSLEELEELHKAGLSWLFVGIESGCDEVLEYMKKGVNSREHIEGGQKVMAAGINLAAFVMPGLAGKNGELQERHVLETIKILNEIKPSEVRVRSLAVLRDSPLYLRWESGEFEAATEDQMIDEIGVIIENLNFNCIIETLQMTNVLFNLRGELSVERERILANIASYNALPPLERLWFRLNRYLSDGYLDFVKRWGKFDSQLSQLIEEAKEGLKNESPDVETKTEQAIFAIKSKGIP
jgi:hypothetical protein